MTQQWYALRTKPRKEDVVWRQVKQKDIEGYYPRLRVNPVNPRSRKVRPYFPGYVFVHVDLEDHGRSVFKWMPYSLGLVSFGDVPAHVPENLIHAIQKKMDQIMEAGGESAIGLKKGDEVKIQSGPFEGYKAIFDEKLSGNDRVRVLLSLLGDRQVVTELHVGHIERVKKS